LAGGLEAEDRVQRTSQIPGSQGHAQLFSPVGQLRDEVLNEDLPNPFIVIEFVTEPIQLGLIQEGQGVPVVPSNHCPSATRDSLFILGNRGRGSTGQILKEGLHGAANFDVSAAGSRTEDFEGLLIGAPVLTHDQPVSDLARVTEIS
jgi:hypothetical protein